MDLDLIGRVAVVTGGSGAIGRAIASTFAREGAAVAVTYLTNPTAAQTVVEDITRTGGVAMAVRLDVRSSQSIETAYGQVSDEFGSFDILVNCAGVASFSPLGSHTEADWDRVMDTNVKGAFLCSREALPYFADRAAGDIVNVSSLAGYIGSFEGPAYAASKAALDNLTLSLALELASSNVRVNGVAPGRIETPFRRATSGPYFDFMLEQTPAGRLGTPQEIANACVFLASRVCAFATGTTLLVSGGLHTVYLRHVSPDPGSKLA